MARTRSKPAPKAKEASPQPTPSSAKPLPKPTTNPPKLFVLPKDTAKDARIVTLNNPATGTPSRYYFCPRKGFYEFTRIAAPKKDCRSWLITSDADSSHVATENNNNNDTDMRIGSGYITSAADLFIATPIDVLFLLLPVLAPTSAKDTKQHFLALDDYLDMLSSSSRHWKALLIQHASLRTMLETRLRALCDTVDAGDDSMFRLSHPKLAAILHQKAQRMAHAGLPPSLEEKFVTTALQVPVLSVKRDDVVEATSGDSNIVLADDDNNNTTTTTTTTTSTTSITEPSTPPSIPPLLRTHTSLTYLTKTYLPPLLPPLLHPLLNPHFTPLTTHLAHLASLKAEATALRSLSDNISRKRAAGGSDVLDEDEDEGAAARKRRKREEEQEKKGKVGVGRAIKQLGKVDTSGMRKMSSFFAKVGK